MKTYIRFLVIICMFICQHANSQSINVVGYLNSQEIPTNVIDSIVTQTDGNLLFCFHDGSRQCVNTNNINYITTSQNPHDGKEGDIDSDDDDPDDEEGVIGFGDETNDSICIKDGYTNLSIIKEQDYNTTNSRFRTVRLDLSNKRGDTTGNYVSVILHNLAEDVTSWRQNRIQTLRIDMGKQICDNGSGDKDITKCGRLVEGSNELYEYTFSSLMEIYLIDPCVDKSMVWIKIE